ncbi:unnamed protein product, partial [Laminaria digitata]
QVDVRVAAAAAGGGGSRGQAQMGRWSSGSSWLRVTGEARGEVRSVVSEQQRGSLSTVRMSASTGTA